MYVIRIFASQGRMQVCMHISSMIYVYMVYSFICLPGLHYLSCHAIKHDFCLSKARAKPVVVALA